MQDEIIKHGKKIHATVHNSTHTPWQKIKEILIEIFIIIFAVSFSIWLHGWSEHRHQQQEANKFLSELKEDLAKDIDLLNDNRKTAVILDSNYKFILRLQKDQFGDSMIGPHTDLFTFTTNFNTGRYEGFKSSGKISTIENDRLKNNILLYYQQTIPDLINQSDFLNTEQIKILNAGQNEMGNLSLNEFLTSKKMRSMHYFLEFNFRSAISSLDTSIKKAGEIIEDIKSETGK